MVLELLHDIVELISTGTYPRDMNAHDKQMLLKKSLAFILVEGALYNKGNDGFMIMKGRKFSEKHMR